jgi:hypothetical protein
LTLEVIGLFLPLKFFFQLGVDVEADDEGGVVVAADDRPFVPGETNGGGARLLELLFFPPAVVSATDPLTPACGEKNPPLRPLLVRPTAVVAPAELGGFGTDPLSFARNNAAAPANCESFLGVDGGAIFWWLLSSSSSFPSRSFVRSFVSTKTITRQIQS